MHDPVLFRSVVESEGAIRASILVFYAVLKPVFHLVILFARTNKKVGTVPTCSRRIFSPAKFNQSRCRILVFASRRANKVAKWKTGLRLLTRLNKWFCDYLQKTEIDALSFASLTSLFVCEFSLQIAVAIFVF